MGFSHAQFKELVDRVIPDLTPAESMALRAVSWHETNYGAGWGNPQHTAEPEKAKASRNLGAITMKPLSKNPDGTVECGEGGFRHGDSRRDESSGEVVRYETCFRAYETWEDAVRHLAKVLLKKNTRDAANSGSLHNVATAMRDNSYYLGTAKTRRGQIEDYRRALERAKASILSGTGEPDPLPLTPPPPVVPGSGSDSDSESGGGGYVVRYSRVSAPELHIGCKGHLVRALQAFLDSRTDQPLLVDGFFGPVTEAACVQVLGTRRVPDTMWGTIASRFIGEAQTSPQTPEAKK